MGEWLDLMILRRVAALLVDCRRFVRDNPAVDRHWRACDACSRRARRWSVEGAVQKATRDVLGDDLAAMVMVRRVLSQVKRQAVGDRWWRNHETALAAVLGALAEAKQRPKQPEIKWVSWYDRIRGIA